MGFEPMLNECQFYWKKKLWKEPIETTEPGAQTVVLWFLSVKYQNFFKTIYKRMIIQGIEPLWQILDCQTIWLSAKCEKKWKKVSNWFFVADPIQFLLLYPSETVTVGTVKNLPPKIHEHLQLRGLFLDLCSIFSRLYFWGCWFTHFRSGFLAAIKVFSSEWLFKMKCESIFKMLIFRHWFYLFQDTLVNECSIRIFSMIQWVYFELAGLKMVVYLAKDWKNR